MHIVLTLSYNRVVEDALTYSRPVPVSAPLSTGGSNPPRLYSHTFDRCRQIQSKRAWLQVYWYKILRCELQFGRGLSNKKLAGVDPSGLAAALWVSDFRAAPKFLQGISESSSYLRRQKNSSVWICLHSFNSVGYGSQNQWFDAQEWGEWQCLHLARVCPVSQGTLWEL